ncbi:MAG: DUF3182 family protein [Burkholderiales bacterium]
MSALPFEAFGPSPALFTAPPITHVAFSPRPGPVGHDQLTKRAVAQHLAEVLEAEYIGEPVAELPGSPLAVQLVVPSETVLAGEPARRLGITDARRLFGGVVPFAFVATKVITHPLVRPDAVAPEGWCHVFPDAVRPVVLPGYSVFDAADALEAGEQLMLAEGHPVVRLKLPQGVGGSGQFVVRSMAELTQCVQAIDPALLRAEGLVLECNLREVATFSVGQVSVGPYLASYCGTQRLVTNHAGHEVYGGSKLLVVRGGYERLLAQPVEACQRAAVEQARVYHAQAMACFPGLLATRCNYDIAQGRDEAGLLRSGVLEQSWRIGGATGAEVMALQAFRDDDQLQVVEAVTQETYGEPGELPAGAKVYYDGIDPQVGRLVKAAWVQRHGHA